MPRVYTCKCLVELLLRALKSAAFFPFVLQVTPILRQDLEGSKVKIHYQNHQKPTKNYSINHYEPPKQPTKNYIVQTNYQLTTIIQTSIKTKKNEKPKPQKPQKPRPSVPQDPPGPEASLLQRRGPQRGRPPRFVGADPAAVAGRLASDAQGAARGALLFFFGIFFFFSKVVFYCFFLKLKKIMFFLKLFFYCFF